MSDVVPERINIQQEEVAYRAAVSEATMSRVGAAINLINMRQYDSKQFFVNGPYQATNAIDGASLFLFDAEIVGLFMFNIKAGTSGTSEFNVRRFTASGGSGTTIFSTRPAIASSAGNNAYLAVGLSPYTVLENPSGTTLPVFTTTTVDAGDMIVADLTSIQAGGENCGLVLFYRPR